MLRIGVIGCGKIAEKHLNAYRKIQDVEITVTDIVEKGKTIASNYGAHWHEDPEELIASSKIDAVDVCIPTPSHADVILKALKSGKHVFCEKPLARNLEEALQIQERTAQSGKVVMVGYLYRFHPAFQFAKRVLQEGVIGKPYYAIFRLGGRGSHKAWKHKQETGGGAGNEMLVHMLDLILWYFGEAKSIRNLYVDTLLGEREIEGKLVKSNAEDVIWLKLDMADGTRVICESDLITPSYTNHVEIQGTNGSLWASILDYFPTLVYCMEPKGVYDRGHNFLEFPKVDLFEKELGHFVDCLKTGGRPAINSVEDSIKIMKIVESTIVPAR